MSSVNDIYNALQSFRAYVEANMPYKETVYFGTNNPTAVSTPANIGAMYFQTNGGSTAILNVYYKASTGNTDWLPFGTGGSTPSNAVSNTAGLNIIADVDTPVNLDFTLLNAEGGTISLSSPLNLYFQKNTNSNVTGYFETVPFTSPITFSLTPTATLGVTQNTAQKLYVYVGLKSSDPTQKIVALKVNSRLNTINDNVVYDFRSTTQSKDRVYANLATSTTSDNYRLKLISIVDITYTTGIGWQVPTLITPYLPELDIISDKLLTDDIAGVPLRQQLNSIAAGKATLKDFQILFNNLSAQTYAEINTIKDIVFSVNSSATTSDFKQYYSFILKPSISGLTFTIPDIADQKSIVLKNSGNYNLIISYSTSPTETFVLEPNEIVNAVFCGTSVVTTPKIINLTNKTFPNTLSLKASYSSGLIVTAKHPDGSSLSSSNYVKIDLPSFSNPNVSNAELDLQTFKFTSNFVLTLPPLAHLGLNTSANYPQLVYVYLYNGILGQGLAVCGVKKLYENKFYNVMALDASSQTAGQLYGSVDISTVAIKFLGTINFNYVTKAISGINLSPSSVFDQLENITDDGNSSTFIPIVNNDTVFNAIKKSASNDSWLRTLYSYGQDVGYVKQLPLLAPADGTVNYNISFIATADSNGFPNNLGQRYCIMDFATSKTIGIYSNPNSVLFVADVVTADVTLKWLNTDGLGTVNQTLVLTGGKKYYIWIASVAEYSNIDALSLRMRIISKYPEDIIPPQNVTKNFKALNLATINYTALVNDALILGNNNVANFNITLPNVSVVVGSKVYIYCTSVATSYPFTYTIYHSSGVAFYQTIEDGLVISNGGFYLEFEYTLISSTPYWYVTSFNYLL